MAKNTEPSAEMTEDEIIDDFFYEAIETFPPQYQERAKQLFSERSAALQVIQSMQDGTFRLFD